MANRSLRSRCPYHCCCQRAGDPSKQQIVWSYLQQSWERYGDGQAYRNGGATDKDLSMTIVEYSPLSEQVPEPATLGLLTAAVLGWGFWKQFRRRGGN